MKRCSAVATLPSAPAWSSEACARQCPRWPAPARARALSSPPRGVGGRGLRPPRRGPARAARRCRRRSTSRDRGQVVRGDAGGGVGGVAGRRAERARVALEPQHAVGEHGGRVEPLAKPLRHGAEVLADDEAARAPAFQRQRAEEILERVAHVRAFGRRGAVGHPEEAREPHHVVDAQRPRVARVGGDESAEAARSRRRPSHRAAAAAGSRPVLRRRTGRAARRWRRRAQARPAWPRPPRRPVRRPRRGRGRSRSRAPPRAAACAELPVGHPLQARRRSRPRANCARRIRATPGPSGRRSSSGQRCQGTPGRFGGGGLERREAAQPLAALRRRSGGTPPRGARRRLPREGLEAGLQHLALGGPHAGVVDVRCARRGRPTGCAREGLARRGRLRELRHAP